MGNYKNLDDGLSRILEIQDLDRRKELEELQNKFTRDEIIRDFGKTTYRSVPVDELLELQKKEQLSKSESFLIGYDKSENDHTILTVVSVEGVNYKLINSFVGEKAENMYKLLKGEK